MDFEKTANRLKTIANILWYLSVVGAGCEIIYIFSTYINAVEKYPHYAVEEAEYNYIMWGIVIAIVILVNAAVISNILKGFACIVYNTGNMESEIRDIKNIVLRIEIFSEN